MHEYGTFLTINESIIIDTSLLTEVHGGTLGLAFPVVQFYVFWQMHNACLYHDLLRHNSFTAQKVPCASPIHLHFVLKTITSILWFRVQMRSTLLSQLNLLMQSKITTCTCFLLYSNMYLKGYSSMKDGSLAVWEHGEVISLPRGQTWEQKHTSQASTSVWEIHPSDRDEEGLNWTLKIHKILACMPTKCFYL